VASELNTTYLPSALISSGKGVPLLALPKLPVASVEQAAMSPGAAAAGTPRRETIDIASIKDKRAAMVTLDFPGREDVLNKVSDIEPTPRIDSRSLARAR
jgi:hypothetical protein